MIDTKVEDFHIALLHVLSNRGYKFDETFSNSLSYKSLAQVTDILETCYGDEAYKILEEATKLIRR